MIENTAQRDPMLHLLGTMSDGNDRYIEGMEAAGQRQLVNSDRLPTQLSGGTEDQFIAVGFTFGDPDPRDPLFRPATLPAGWTRQGTDHALHSNILDEHGRRRVGVFYKAASYDRRADMSLIGLGAYLRGVLRGDTTLIFDDTWATRDAVVKALGEIRDSEQAQADEWAERITANSPDHYRKYVAEHTEAATKAATLLAEVGS